MTPAPSRLALVVSADRERRVVRVTDTGRAPKTVQRFGRTWSVVCTMDPKHADVAAWWARGARKGAA